MTQQEISSIYQAHGRRLYNIRRRILLNPEDAEEVMHDTLIKFVTAPLLPMSREQASAWLTRTCIRASVDRLRKRRREAAFREAYLYETAGETEDADIPPEVSARRILDALQRLPDPYRLVVTLVLAEGLDYGEIAGFTGTKESTLRSQFLRGKQKLIALLKEDGEPI